MKRLIITCIACLLSTAALLAQQTYQLSLRTSPQDGICLFSVSYNNGNSYNAEGYTHQIPAGVEVKINTTYISYYYHILGEWKLTGWRVTQGTVVLQTPTFYDSGGGSVQFIMPEGDVSITAIMEYNPDNPEDPQSLGAWYPDEGLLVMDYMDSRDFNNTLRSIIPDESDYSLVRKIIVGGHLNYWGGFSFLDKLAYLERVDLSRLSGDTYYRIQWGEGRNKAWKQLLLPASISMIQSNAFTDTYLESLTIFATTPPTIGIGDDGHQNAFPSAETMVVYVPEESMSLYANTPGWSDFDLQPIVEDGANITINLDAGERLADYNGMALKLQDVKSLFTRTMIVTERTAYTFPTMPKNTTYSLQLLSRTGSVVAHADNIFLGNEKIELTLGGLKRLCTLTLQVKEGNQTIDGNRFSCLWLDQTGNVIGRGTKVNGILEDEPVKALIALNDATLETTYLGRDTITIDRPIDYAEQGVVYTLRAIPTHRLLTHVLRADGEPMGRQSVSQSIYRVDANGSELVRQETFDTPTAQGGVTNNSAEPLPEGIYDVMVHVENSPLATATQRIHLHNDMTATFSLKEANGSQVKIVWTHYDVAAEDESLADAHSITKPITEAALTLRDQTNGVDLTDFSVSPSGIVRLQETLEAGTEVELTLGNPEGSQFASVTKTAKADADGNVAFDITTRDYATLNISFKETECSEVAVKIMGSNGQLVASDKCTSINETSFNLLRDDVYTIVLMDGTNSTISAFNTLDDIKKFLNEGADYVTQQLDLTSGITATANFDYVPVMAGDMHLYTDDVLTRITPRKDVINAGAYQTISTNVMFLPEYRERISQPEVVYTISEDDGIHLVDGSVMNGNGKAAYTLKDGLLTVPLVEGQLQRFCIYSHKSGEYTLNGRIVFLFDGEPCEQPLSTTPFTVNGPTIVAPETSANEQVMVCGTALPYMKVHVFINNEEKATCLSNNDGNWAVKCQLASTTNLSENIIYAQYENPNGFQIKTPYTSTTFNSNFIFAKKVTMKQSTNNWSIKQVVFDLENSTCSPSSLTVTPMFTAPLEYHFEAELNVSDSTGIDDVLLYAYSPDGNTRTLTLKYNSEKGTWWGSEYCVMPTSVAVNVVGRKPQILGQQELHDRLHASEDIVAEYEQDIASIEQRGQEIDNMEEGSDEQTQAIVQMLMDAGLYTDTDAAPSPYPDTEEGLQQLMDDVQAAIPVYEAALAKANAADLGWDVTPISLDDIGDLIPGYSFTKLSASTREYYAARSRGEHPAPLPAAGPNENEYVLDCDDGSQIIYRLHDNGYVLIVPSEDMQLMADFNAMPAEVRAMSRDLRDALGELSRLQSMAPYKAKDSAFITSLTNALDKVLSSLSQLSGYISNLVEWVEKGTQEGVRRTKEVIHDLKLDTKAQQNVFNYMSPNKEKFPKWMQKESNRLAQLVKETSMKCSQLRAHAEKLQKWAKNIKILGKILSAFSLYNDIKDFSDAVWKTIQLYQSIPDPCKLDQAKADAIARRLVGFGTTRIIQKGYAIVSDVSSICAAIGGTVTAPTVAGAAVGWGGAMLISTIKWGANLAFDCWFGDFFKDIEQEIKSLKCDTIPCRPANSSKCCKTPSCNPNPPKPGPPPYLTYIMDPSGYIYEGVASNRVADAVASIYYKEYYEDIYGDEQERDVLWDAEAFDQVNPQLTDAEGKYGWDVPEGWWQVRVTKDGYLPTNSEWLPVPPPQLDVNLEMQQPTPPTIKRVVATEQGVQVDFDKYMKPQHLTTENIFLTKNGQKLDGTIQLLDQEWTPDKAHRFASRLLFTPATPLKLKEKVRLTAKAGIESYANVGMLQDFSQEFDVEERVNSLMADSVWNVLHGDSHTFTITAQPASAAKGKKVVVSTAESSIATIMVNGSPAESTELTLDEQGHATYTVRGLNYGSTVINIALKDDADVAVKTIIGVKDNDGMMTRMPTASLISGVEVSYGTKVKLQSETTGAIIYYTTDGTCPCENPNRLRYDGPIAITRDVVLKAIAVAPGFAESDVASFNYHVKRDPLSITTAESTGITNAVYTLQGIKMKQGSQLKQGVYLVGKKKMVVK